MIIQLLHESNSFFGLVGEAEYYQPLVERVRVISDSTLEKKTDVILTGHSLGGGLSRIVAALTHLPSVSFAPPGIALSHRKFSILEEKKGEGETTAARHHSNLNRKISGMVDLHDQSMAVITDFDM
jgi:putative lipase involved disintegration of autophagic bodies